MTRNNAQKKTIRDRMVETGESYAVAMRKLEAAVSVWELGEDGDTWFVEGTQDAVTARKALEEWIFETYGFDSVVAVEWVMDWLPYLENAKPVIRADWFWKPAHKEHPDEEAYLRSKEKNLAIHEGEKLMQGCYFSL